LVPAPHAKGKALAFREGEHSEAWPLCEDSACPHWPRPGGHGLFIDLDVDFKFRKLECTERGAHVSSADRVVPGPVARPDPGRLDDSGQRRREPVRGRGRPGLRRPTDGRRHPGQQLQRQGQRAGHRDHPGAGLPGRPGQRVRQHLRAAGRPDLPGRHRADHRAGYPARRLGAGRQPADHQRRRAARPEPGRLPHRPQRPGHGGGDDHEHRHRR